MIFKKAILGAGIALLCGMALAQINDDGEPKALEVSVNDAHACAVLRDHTVQCWGRSVDDGTGDSIYHSVPAPVIVPGLSNVRKIATGANSSCALTFDGDLYCWDAIFMTRPSNERKDMIFSFVPKLIMNDIVDIGMGGSHSCAVRRDAHISCWGENDKGQITRVPSQLYFPPTPVPEIDNAVQVIATLTHSCALTSQGKVLCWGGYNLEAQLGTDKNVTFNEVVLPKRAIAITGRGYFTCATLEDRTLNCWGLLPFGMNPNAPSLPTEVIGLRSIQDASAGDGFACSVANYHGTVMCAGTNSGLGTLGDGLKNDSAAFTEILANGEEFAHIAAGWHSACAVTQAGKIYCWGMNYVGEVGANGHDNEIFLSPVPVTLARFCREIATKSILRE